MGCFSGDAGASWNYPRSMRYLRYTPKLNSCTTQKRDFVRAIMDYDESIRAAISII